MTQQVDLLQTQAADPASPDLIARFKTVLAKAQWIVAPLMPTDPPRASIADTARSRPRRPPSPSPDRYPQLVPDHQENAVKVMRTLLLPTGLAMTLAAASAQAAEPASLQLVIKDHRFEPAELRVPANTPLVIEVRNEDDTAEEFESAALRVEKVIAGKRQGTVRLKPLRPGRYPFIGEDHPDTAQGVIVAE